jgi:hypothetical protein
MGGTGINERLTGWRYALFLIPEPSLNGSGELIWLNRSKLKFFTELRVASTFELC